MVEVIEVPAAATFPLRQAVLRPHQSVAELAEEEQAYPGSGIYGVVDEVGDVVATGTVSPRDGWQVRAMAVAPDRQGQGIGSAVLAALLAHVRRRGGGRVWCNVRIPARGLYEQAGFVAVGDPFDVDHIGPHVVMTREVVPDQFA